MDEKLYLLVLSVVVSSVASSGHVFFHEPSAILMKPAGKINPESDFGFALGHWNGSLIVGAPSSNLVGEVYACPLAGITGNSLSCNILDLFHPNNYTRELNPSQKFYLGGSITSTKDFLFTCAPLVTKDVRMSKSTTTYTDAVGSCFIYTNNTSTEYRGPESRYAVGEGARERFEGGTGWTSLADEDTGFLLIAKTSVYGDINYIDTMNPREKSKSLSDRDKMRFKQNNLDIGYGITAGKFFSNNTVYAFSKQNVEMTGQIVFLEVQNTKKKDKEEKKLKLILNKKKLLNIENKVVGAMFGYCLAAADITQDGLSELIVGAPLESEDKNEIEVGAVHIYIGGKYETINEGSRMRTIYGDKNLGRFGTTIAANDIDGDSIPEIFVSAPYEDSGVVYVISGHELKDTLFSTTTSLTIQISAFKHTQKVIRGDLMKLGFSLFTVPDMDGNGSHELAIGAPGSASAILLKSLQTINVTVTSELIGTSVREKDDNFKAKICYNIGYSKNSNNITGYVIIKNDIDGYAEILNPNITVDLSKKLEHECQPITVNLTYHQKYDYTLRTNVELKNVKSLKSKDFDPSWVQLSTYSVVRTNLVVLRRCSGDDCNPDLSVDIQWKNKESLHKHDTKGAEKDKSKSQWYEVESTEVEVVTLFVRNKGYEASEACVWVEITGAPVYKLGKCYPKPPLNPTGYECTLPTSFRRGDEMPFHVHLNMTRLSFADDSLLIKAQIYENCYARKGNATRDRTLKINYEFEKAWKHVHLDGVLNDVEITDVEISEALKMKGDDTTGDEDHIFKAEQQYLIFNDGNVMWNNAEVVIDIENRTFINKVDTSEKSCAITKGDNHKITCKIDLTPHNITKILVWAELLTKDVGKYISKKHSLNVTSQMKIFMNSAIEKTEFYQKSLTTEIKMKKDIGFKNNKLLIALVAALLALLLLALITYFLCKRGFFQRKEKKKLAVLRASVRRHSVRLASERSSTRNSRLSARPRSSGEENTDIGIEVTEDSPFEEVPINAKDNAVLLDTQAQVHNENNKHSARESRSKLI